MKYPSMGRGRQYRATVPQLSGGLHLSDSPEDLEDNELTAAQNLWWKRGALCARPGVQAQDSYLRAWANAVPETETLIPDDCTDETGVYRNLVQCYTMGITSTYYATKLRYDGSIETYPSAGVSFNEPPRTPLYIGAGNQKYPEGLLLIGGNLYTVNERGAFDPLDPYVPLVVTEVTGSADASTAALAGYNNEGFNLLTDAFRIAYTTDGEALYFKLHETAQDRAGQLTVSVVGTDGATTVHTLTHTEDTEEESGGSDTEQEAAPGADGLYLVWDVTRGLFWFLQQEEGGTPSADPVALPETVTDGMTATFQPQVDAPAGKALIAGMTTGIWFGGGAGGLRGGNRYFLSGNPQEPNLVHYSAADDPTYFPENGYLYVGSSAQPVTAFARQDSLLVVFKTHEIYCLDYLRITMTADEVIRGEVIDTAVQSAAFPVTPIHSQIGCDCPRTIQLCLNRLVWTTSDGRVYTLVTQNQYSERNVREISYKVEPLLTGFTASELQAAWAIDYDGCYVLLVGRQALLFNYADAGFVYITSYYSSDSVQKKLAWYQWELPVTPVLAFARERQAVLLVKHTETVSGSEKDIFISYTLTGDRDAVGDVDSSGALLPPILAPIACAFETKTFDFGYPERYKRIPAVSLSLRGDRLTMQYVTERGRERDVTIPPPTEEPVVTVAPNQNRTLRFGVRCAGDGVCCAGMSIRYTMTGEVR